MEPGTGNGAPRARSTDRPAGNGPTMSIPPASGATPDQTTAPATPGSPADATATVALNRVDLDQAGPDRTGTSGEADHTIPWFRQGTGPVPVPPPKVRHRWRKLIGRTLSKAWGDSLFGLSSQAAFWCALSTAPLLLALLGLIG